MSSDTELHKQWQQGLFLFALQVSMFARGLPAWGSQRPRTKKTPHPSIPVASDRLLTGAAAAAAEAEDAAAVAAAHTLVRNSYTAEMSGTHRIGSAQQPQEQRPGLVLFE